MFYRGYAIMKDKSEIPKAFIKGTNQQRVDPDTKGCLYLKSTTFWKISRVDRFQ